MALHCGACGAAVERKDADVARRFARCPACGAAHDLKLITGDGGTRASLRRLPDVPMPAGYSLSRDGPLVLQRRWLRATARASAPVLASIAVILAMLLAIAAANWLFFSMGRQWLRAFHVPLWLEWSTVVAGNGLLAYLLLALLFNSTWFTVASGRLTVRHGPLPWPWNRDLDASRIERLVTVSRITKSTSSSSGPGRQRSTSYSVTYEVHAGMADRLVLLDRFRIREEALFVEQTLRGHLGIGHAFG